MAYSPYPSMTAAWLLLLVSLRSTADLMDVKATMTGGGFPQSRETDANQGYLAPILPLSALSLGSEAILGLAERHQVD